MEAYGNKNKITLNGRTVYISLCAPLSINEKSGNSSEKTEAPNQTLNPIKDDEDNDDTKLSKRQRKGLYTFPKCFFCYYISYFQNYMLATRIFICKKKLNPQFYYLIIIL